MEKTVIPAGTTAEDIVLVESRMQIEVRDIGIPPRPAILEKITAEMERDAPDFRRLAEAIGSDVALAAGLIKTTNSPYFGFGRKVRSVNDALLVLGLKVIVRTVAGLSLHKVFKNLPSLERFWDASANTARVSGWLAHNLPGHHAVKAEDAYTFALFRDCGVPVLMIPFPEYLGVLQQANEDAENGFTEVEDRVLSINHALVGAELAENWLLPADIFQAIRYHHDVTTLQSEGVAGLSRISQALIAIAQLAEYLLHRHTGLNRTREWDKLGETCLQLLGLGEDDLESLFAASREVVFATQN